MKTISPFITALFSFFLAICLLLISLDEPKPRSSILPTPIPTGNEVLGIQINTCCSCPTLIPQPQLGQDGWILYEPGKNYSQYLPQECKQVDCQPCTPLNQNTNNLSDPLTVAQNYLDAYTSGNWTVAKELSGDSSFDEFTAKSYGFNSYKILSSKADNDPNYYHVYIEFTDNKGKKISKLNLPNTPSIPLEVLMSKNPQGEWRAMTWYFLP